MIYEKIKCPLCGCQSDVDKLGREPHTLAVALKDIGGRGKCSWTIKYGGYTALKKKLIPILEKIIFKLDKENGCDLWPDCLSCMVSLDQCPDQVARASQKHRKVERLQTASELKEQGLSTAEIAERLGKSDRTIRRNIREAKQ